MNVGRAVDAALSEFRGRTPAEIATAAHQAYSSMQSLQLPSLPAPPPAVKPAREKRRKVKSKAKPAASAKSTKVTYEADGKAVRIVKILSGANNPLPAREIAAKLDISGQGLGPILHKMSVEGMITRKKSDGEILWGSKSKLNGKSHAQPN